MKNRTEQAHPFSSPHLCLCFSRPEHGGTGAVVASTQDVDTGSKKTKKYAGARTRPPIRAYHIEVVNL